MTTTSDVATAAEWQRLLPEAMHLHPAISHVVLNWRGCSEGYPREIVLRYSDHIVVEYNYGDSLPDLGCKVLGDGLDVVGNGLVMIPVDQVRSWLTDEAADAVIQAIDADAMFLAHAHG